MEIGGFEFTVDEIDGCRVIEAVYPPVVDVSKLSAVISYYFDLWDEDVPTVSLVDLSQLSAFTDEVRQVLKSVIQRTVLQPSFVGAAWYTRENRAIFDEIVRVRREAGRTSDDVFETREEAVDYVRGLIAAWYERDVPSPEG
jgi:hypothetical protein